MRWPCFGYGIDCLWLLFLKPKTGRDKWYVTQILYVSFQITHAYKMATSCSCHSTANNAAACVYCMTKSVGMHVLYKLCSMPTSAPSRSTRPTHPPHHHADLNASLAGHFNYYNKTQVNDDNNLPPSRGFRINSMASIHLFCNKAL